MEIDFWAQNGLFYINKLTLQPEKKCNYAVYGVELIEKSTTLN